MGLFANHSEIRSPKVQTLLRWWLDYRGDGIPDRSQLDPADMKRLLPHLLLLDVEHEPFRVRFRLVGTRVQEATGFNITGRYLDELLPASADQQWMQYYHQAYSTRLPVVGSIAAPTTTGAVFTYEFGLFPLSNGGVSVERFVSIEDYFDLSVSFAELVEWQEVTPEMRSR